MSLIQKKPTQKNQATNQNSVAPKEQIKKQEEEWDEVSAPGNSVFNKQGLKLKENKSQKPVQGAKVIEWHQDDKNNIEPTETVEVPVAPVVQEETTAKPKARMLNFNFGDRKDKVQNNNGFELDQEEFVAIGQEAPVKKNDNQISKAKEPEPATFKGLFTNSKLVDGKDKPIELDAQTRKFLEKDSQIQTTYGKPKDGIIRKQEQVESQIIETKGVKVSFTNANKNPTGEISLLKQKSEAEIQQEEAELRAEEKRQQMIQQKSNSIRQNESSLLKAASEPVPSSENTTSEKPSLQFLNSQKEKADGPIEKPLAPPPQDAEQLLKVMSAPASAPAPSTKTEPTVTESVEAQKPMFSNQKKDDANFVSIEKALLEKKPVVQSETVETSPVATIEKSKSSDKKESGDKRSNGRRNNQGDGPKKQESQEQLENGNGHQNHEKQDKQENVENESDDENDEGWNEVTGGQKKKHNGNKRNNQRGGAPKGEQNGTAEKKQSQKTENSNQDAAAKAQPPAVKTTETSTSNISNTTTNQKKKVPAVVATTQTWDE